MDEISRRGVLLGGGAAVTAGLLGTTAKAASATQAPTSVTVTGSGVGTGTYNYHTFTMPAGVNKLDVALTKTTSPMPTYNNVGLGIFDPRGSQYATKDAPNGFRGIFGQERSAFTITPATATNAFIPGPLTPGTWTLVVPIFMVGPQPLTYTITATMTYGEQPTAFVYGAEVDLVRDTPGWYRGDLHCHTQASSDALSSGSAMLPADWAKTCQRIGLNFVALTDHNVVNQNFALAAAAAGTEVLVMAGEEMTNWFWGHATVSGISPGDWLDWRQLPGEQYDAQAMNDPTTGRIQDFISHARSLGAFIAAAHPLGATLAWRFFGDAAADPAARTDSLEVWTGPFQPDDQASVNTWDSQLQAGQRIVANGGSDLHRVVNSGNTMAGTPTTVVFAAALGKQQVIAALRAGRSFITRLPMGAEAYLSVTNATGDQRQIMGGTVYGAASDLLTVTVDVRRAVGFRLDLIRDGAVFSTTMLTDPDQTVSTTTPMGPGGYVRAELHSGTPQVDPTNPTAGRLDMEALTNPVWLQLGAVPVGTVRDGTQPPPPDGTSAPTALPELGTPGLLPVAGLAVGAAAIAAVRRRRAPGPRTVTHTEFGLWASDPRWRESVTLTGQITVVDGEAALLTRWIPGCCGAEGALHVTVLGAWGLEGAAPEVGQWFAVTGLADPDANAEVPLPLPEAHTHPVPGVPARRTPVLRASSAKRLQTAPPRREV